MATLFSVNFQFENADHACLVTTKLIDNRKSYKITVMNGELEQLLHGDNYLLELDGTLQFITDPQTRNERLKNAITAALQKHFQESELSLASDLN